MAFPVPLRAHLKNLAAYVPGKPVEEVERELGITGAVKLASNENPLGPSPRVAEALRAAIDQVQRYPDGSVFYLKRALAARLGVGPERLMVGHGSNELLVLLAQVVLEPGDEVLYADPSFVVYPIAAKLFQAVGRPVPLKDHTHDLPAFTAALGPRTRLVYLCNPNNPTGTVVPLLAVEAFLKTCGPDVLVVLDEAYYEYVEMKTYFESVRLLEKYPNLVILRTFSKAYGLAGLRVGYGLGDPALVDAFQRVRQPFNVNSLALAGAEAALGDGDHVRKVLDLNRASRAAIEGGLDRLGLAHPPSHANFVYFQAADAPALYGSLLAQGVITRPMGPRALRVTTGTMEETERFLSTLEKTMGAKP
ncbi:MAG TPA: histidinol-phosphate transaminase [bacterium]|nr:histidinol-phosphate transaminase [bacterium]